MTKHRTKIIDTELQWMEPLVDCCAVSKLPLEEAMKFIVNVMDFSHKLMLENIPDEEYPTTLEQLFNKAIVPFMPSVHVHLIWMQKLRSLKQDPEKDVQESDKHVEEVINQHAKLENQLKLISPPDQVKIKCTSSAQCMRLMNALHPQFVSSVTKIFETEARAQDWPTLF